MKSFIVEQKITAFANQYRIFDVVADQKGSLLAFAHQKRLAFKEEIEFFTSEERSQLAFSVKAEKVLDIHGKFIVRGANAKPLGAARKVFKSSLLRSTWEILNNKDEVAVIVRERSQGLAVFRRIWSFIPYLGDVPFLFKYHFDFRDPKTQKLLAGYSKTTLWRDHYRLDIHDESLIDDLGWQTLAAMAVLLDALQGR